MDSLDLGVLSVVASFGYPEELVGLGLALGKDRGAELLGLTATVDAILRATASRSSTKAPRLRAGASAAVPRFGPFKSRRSPTEWRTMFGTGITSPASTE